MDNESVVGYIRNLSDLLLRLQVTDTNGAILSLDKGTKKAVNMIVSLKAVSRKAMLIGNGGSAAIANHMQNDLCKAVGVQAIVFNEAPLLTALSNDYGYGCAFERLVGLWAKPGDLLFAISSSGQSENILRAAQVAIKQGCQVITLSGFNAENPLRRLGNLNFYVPSQIYGFVEIAHSALTHFLTDCAMSSRSCRRKLRD